MNCAVRKSQPVTNRHPSAATDSENEDFEDAPDAAVSNYEFLRYGAHISQYDSTVEMCGRESSSTGRGGCVYLQHLATSSAATLVLGNTDVCRMALQMLIGFQSDLFMLNTDGESGCVWIKTATASHSCLQGTTTAATQQLLDWFVGMADDTHFCRTIAAAVMTASSLPISERRTRKLGAAGGGQFFVGATGQPVSDPAECSAVWSDATLPLYAAVHGEREALMAHVAELEQQLTGSCESWGDAPTMLSLYLNMQQWRRLFATITAVLQSTRSIYKHCSEQWDSASRGYGAGSSRVDRRLYTGSPKAEAAEGGHSDRHGMGS